MNTNDPVVVTAVLSGVFLLVLGLVHVSDRWSERRLRRWCRARHFTLLDWRGAKFFEGPQKWRQSENQATYWIQVRDRDGFTREGYLVFGSYWHPFSRKATVTWD